MGQHARIVEHDLGALWDLITNLEEGVRSNSPNAMLTIPDISVVSMEKRNSALKEKRTANASSLRRQESSSGEYLHRKGHGRSSRKAPSEASPRPATAENGEQAADLTQNISTRPSGVTADNGDQAAQPPASKGSDSAPELLN